MSGEIMTAVVWTRPTLSEEAKRICRLAEGMQLSLAVDTGLPLWVRFLLSEVESERHDGRLMLGRLEKMLDSDEWESAFEPVGKEGENWARGLSRWVWAQVVKALNERAEDAELSVYVEATVSLWGHDISTDGDEAFLDLWGNTYNGDFATELFDDVVQSLVGRCE